MLLNYLMFQCILIKNAKNNLYIKGTIVKLLFQNNGNLFKIPEVK
jgi:hypothetical protein